MEHRYTTLRIESELEELGLQFLGFTIHNPQVKASYRAQFPDDPNMTDLTHWDHFETSHPNTFSRMYHFWCQKEAPRVD